MLRVVSHPHRPQSEHIMCYLNRTYHVLPTPGKKCPRQLLAMELVYRAQLASRLRYISVAFSTGGSP
jgi:hypothetical protein